MSRILIIKTGQTAREALEAFGDYDRWFIDAMPHPGVSFHTIDATLGVAPGIELLEGYDGAIVTGSVSAAYRTESWMPPLEEFLRAAERARVPILCVCFGAQILAQARGGRVILNPSGWEIGSVDIDLTPAGLADPLFEGLSPSFKALATHEDRIERLPPGAAVLASNAGTPVQALRASERIWGVQFHPEATLAIIEKLIRLRASGLERDAADHGIPVTGHIERLLATLSNPEPNQARKVLANFVRLCRGAGRS
jgi:GMP synthase (glutamine-hydrolysing)